MKNQYAAISKQPVRPMKIIMIFAMTFFIHQPGYGADPVRVGIIGGVQEATIDPWDTDTDATAWPDEWNASSGTSYAVTNYSAYADDDGGTVDEMLEQTYWALSDTSTGTNNPVDLDAIVIGAANGGILFNLTATDFDPAYPAERLKTIIGEHSNDGLGALNAPNASHIKVVVLEWPAYQDLDIANFTIPASWRTSDKATEAVYEEARTLRRELAESNDRVLFVPECFLRGWTNYATIDGMRPDPTTAFWIMRISRFAVNAYDRLIDEGFDQYSVCQQ